MAGKIIPMSKIKQILQMYKMGNGRKTIARKLGISKTTVKSYLDKLKTINFALDKLLEMDGPILEAKFHAGNPAYKDNSRYEYIKENLDYFIKELIKPGVTRKLLWEEYRSHYPYGYGYTQFCFHFKQQLIAKKPSMVLQHKPAEKLYVDFAGKKMSYVDINTGEIIQCPVFIACLPYSDNGFAVAVRSQSLEDFIYALRLCLEFLGGVPCLLIPDNLKSAITRANNYEPDINQALEDFANHYGTAVIPTRVAKPQDKALVEDHVKLFYTRVMAKLRNETFFSIESLNKAISEKMLDHSQTRMQQKPYCREEKFLADEKPLLKPLPEEPYEIKYYKEYKVAKNNHIYLTQDKHYYSVPYRWTGQRAKVIYTRSIVKIYIKGELAAVHQRDKLPGKYTTVKEHLCSYHQHYLDRSPDYYRTKAKEISENFYQVVDILFNGGRHPEQNYRSCDGLFSLYRKTNPEIFDKACIIAIEYGSCSYRHMLKVIENLKKQPGLLNEVKHKPLPDHENIRGRDYYTQISLKF
ncbi:MAG: IS21 family transposase [Bacteroidetes bacterium]|nr:IS21 family transposase [Bacteroidota bacterium]